MAQIPQLLARLKRDPLADLPIADHLNQLLAEHKVVWRERLLSPLVTLRLFLIQIAHGNCAIAALRHLAGIDFAISSYCDARTRLPLPLLQSLLQWVHELGEQSAAAGARLARRILIVDGSTHSVEDTPELAKHFTLAPGTRRGVGYPMGKLMGLLDAATGMFLSLLALPLFEHDMRGVIGLHPMLRPGDILLGDRAFCSFAHFALLQARGAFACMHLHQRRKEKERGVVRWDKPRQMPAWMNAQQFAALPLFIEVRIVRYTVARNGYRTRHVLIATTLMNQVIWPDAKVAELYGHRWNIETCFDHLKTTMGMNALRCKTVAGVMKELVIYLAVYNLIRLMMLRAAADRQVAVSRISFIDVMRQLAARLVGLAGAARLIVNPDRTGRCQLRVIRRRCKGYDILVRSRRETEAAHARKQAEIG
jgi:hypothetical protein